MTPHEYILPSSVVSRVVLPWRSTVAMGGQWVPPTYTLWRAACCALPGGTPPLADGSGGDAIPSTACGGRLLSQVSDDVEHHLEVERFLHQRHPQTHQQGAQGER